MSAVRVMIVDDHPIWRSALERELVAAGYDVVGAFGDGEAALRVAAAVRPDVVLMDVQLPGASGMETAAALVERDPSVRILMLSASSEDADVLAAVKVGARGCLLKSASTAELLDAVTRTASGEATFSPRLAALVLGEHRRIGRDEPSPRAVLTDREIEILRMVSTGLAPARSPNGSPSRTAPCRTTSRTRWASCNCTTGSSSPGGPSIRASATDG